MHRLQLPGKPLMMKFKLVTPDMALKHTQNSEI